MSPIVSALSLFANIPGALFWYFNKRLNDLKVNIMLVLVVQTIFHSLMFNVLAVVYEEARFNISNEGLFGIFLPDNLVICLFWFGFMSGFWGLSGYVIC